MNRKYSVILAGFALCLALLAGSAYWLLGYQPGFYRVALLDDLAPEERRKHAEQFTQATLDLVGEIGNEERWSNEFSDIAVNSWLADELAVRYARWLPAGVIAPRVQFNENVLRIAFRTRRGAWSGIVSGRLNVWVSGPNELAIEIQSLSAGLVPIPVDEIVGDLVKSMNDSGWRIQWKQSSSGDVLVLSLEDEVPAGVVSARPILESVELSAGRLLISGRRGTDGITRTAEKPAADPQTGLTEDAVK